MKFSLVFAAPLILASLGTTSVAVAESSAEATQQQPFLILDRPGGASSGGADVSLAFSPANDDMAGLRIDPHLEHKLSERSGFIATLPVGVLLTADEKGTSVGNLDVGGFTVIPTGSGASLVLRGSLALPTASNDRAGELGNIVASAGRVGDVALRLPDAVVVRGAGSYLYESQGLQLRGDIGVDLPRSDDESVSPIFRFSGGVAVGTGATKFIGEVVNLLTSNSEERVTLHQASIGLANETRHGIFKAAVFGVSNDIPQSGEDVVLGASLSHAWSY